MKLEFLPWIILFLPLLAAAVHHAVHAAQRAPSARASPSARSWPGSSSAILFIAANGWSRRGESAANWLSIGDLQVDFGLRLDPLSLMMMLMVTGVGGAIHIYSFGYMHDDRGFSRFFACLSLFTFSMLGIVLANNFLIFIFWELVGVSSYLLIGFWFEQPARRTRQKRRSSPTGSATSGSCSAS